MCYQNVALSYQRKGLATTLLFGARVCTERSFPGREVIKANLRSFEKKIEFIIPLISHDRLYNYLLKTKLKNYS